MKIITTSWDDGHPLDFKVAELLDKYNLKGTFYIPRSNEEHAVMSEANIKTLSYNFEIGGHTLTHARLNGLSKQRVHEEVTGCYHWLTELLGETPVSFCCPGGVYNQNTVKQVVDAGFKLLRTTELLSINSVEGHLLPTTLQLYEHTKSTYLKHLVKRRKMDNFLIWLKSMASSDLINLVNFYIDKIEREGGCLHIWGHSWEIEEFGLWRKLELVFRLLSNRCGFRYLLNQELLFDVRECNGSPSFQKS